MSIQQTEHDYQSNLPYYSSNGVYSICRSFLQRATSK